MTKYVETTRFGDEYADKQCVILDQHSGRGEDFFERYPDVFDLVEVSRETFNDFVNLETDTGAQELSRKIAEKLTEESDGGVAVTLVKSHLPRAVLDTNRVTLKAVRNVLDFGNNRGLEADLREIHLGVITEIRKQLSALLFGSGFFLDIHTMAPYTPGVTSQSPTEVVTEKPDNLSHYIKAYMNARRTGRRRYIDLVTALPGLPPIANVPLTQELMKELDQSHLKYRENDPYPTGPYVMSTEYMSHFPGILIETPKDFLTETQSEHEGFDLINPAICDEKVERIAKPVAAAALRCLKGMR